MDRRGRRSLRFLEKFEHLQAIFLFYNTPTNQNLKCRTSPSGYAKTNLVYLTSTFARGGVPADKSKFEAQNSPLPKASPVEKLAPKVTDEVLEFYAVQTANTSSVTRKGS